MPPAPLWDGQHTSFLMYTSGGETLGAAILGKAPVMCPHPGGWWLYVGCAGSSILLQAPSSLPLLSHQDANVTEGSRHHLPFFFFF